jgi:transposase-like protein
MKPKQLENSGGKISEWKKFECPCNYCGSKEVYYKLWNSDCGKYEDEYYECRGCKKTWMVVGYP